MEIREIGETIKKEVSAFRGPIIVSRGQIHHIDKLPGYVAWINGEISGLVTYHFQNDECEIVSLDSKIENQGIGSKLVELVIDKAKVKRCTRVWLITSNDNIRAIRFYQKRGFDLKAVHRDAITEARKIKPTIPLIGHDGIPIRHEVEFEYVLNG
jgi:GNAT superfamily N-acetyltransferase